MPRFRLPTVVRAPAAALAALIVSACTGGATPRDVTGGNGGSAGSAGPVAGSAGSPSGRGGATGVAGTPGVAGAPGAAGAPGTAGASGVAGAPGTAGTPGTAGATGPAGTSGTAGFVNGTNASALFSSPRGICVNSSGTLYVSEYGNHAIRKIVLTTTP